MSHDPYFHSGCIDESLVGQTVFSREDVVEGTATRAWQDQPYIQTDILPTQWQKSSLVLLICVSISLLDCPVAGALVWT